MNTTQRSKRRAHYRNIWRNVCWSIRKFVRSLSKKINEREIVVPVHPTREVSADSKKEKPGRSAGLSRSVTVPPKDLRALSPPEKAVSVARLGRQQAPCARKLIALLKGHSRCRPIA